MAGKPEINKASNVSRDNPFVGPAIKATPDNPFIGPIKQPAVKSTPAPPKNIPIKATLSPSDITNTRATPNLTASDANILRNKQGNPLGISNLAQNTTAFIVNALDSAGASIVDLGQAGVETLFDEIKQSLGFQKDTPVGQTFSKNLSDRRQHINQLNSETNPSFQIAGEATGFLFGLAKGATVPVIIAKKGVEAAVAKRAATIVAKKAIKKIPVPTLRDPVTGRFVKNTIARKLGTKGVRSASVRGAQLAKAATQVTGAAKVGATRVAVDSTLFGADTLAKTGSFDKAKSTAIATAVVAGLGGASGTLVAKPIVQSVRKLAKLSLGKTAVIKGRVPIAQSGFARKKIKAFPGVTETLNKIDEAAISATKNEAAGPVKRFLTKAAKVGANGSLLVIGAHISGIGVVGLTKARVVLWAMNNMIKWIDNPELLFKTPFIGKNAKALTFILKKYGKDAYRGAAYFAVSDIVRRGGKGAVLGMFSSMSQSGQITMKELAAKLGTTPAELQKAIANDPVINPKPSSQDNPFIGPAK